MRTDEYALADMTPVSAGIYRFTVYMTPAQLAQPVSTAIYDGEDLIKLISEGFSVGNYCQYVLNTPGNVFSSGLKALCAAIINYGAYAQRHFG